MTMADDRVPEFFLYGETTREVESHFLHLESLDERNRPANWNIQPHSHGELHHLFQMAAGRGVMSAGGEDQAFEGPCLLIVPAGIAHGFACEPGTRGSVLTIARAYLDELTAREPAFAALFDEARVLSLGAAMEERFSRLQSELTWTAPGHASVVEAMLVLLLVDALRLSRSTPAQPAAAPGPHAALLARFRALVEASYRQDMGLAGYAQALRVTEKRLRTACARVAGCTPLDVIQDRRAIEAQRLMLYSNLSVSEAAYHLGFSDPAYFSRFFKDRCGRSPRAYRAAGGGARQTGA